jgi:hypothetical protein
MRASNMEELLVSCMVRERMAVRKKMAVTLCIRVHDGGSTAWRTIQQHYVSSQRSQIRIAHVT